MLAFHDHCHKGYSSGPYRFLIYHSPSFSHSFHSSIFTLPRGLRLQECTMGVQRSAWRSLLVSSLSLSLSSAIHVELNRVCDPRARKLNVECRAAILSYLSVLMVRSYFFFFFFPYCLSNACYFVRFGSQMTVTKFKSKTKKRRSIGISIDAITGTLRV
jgi:hypothetical protein